jgi:hypothetical protein
LTMSDEHLTPEDDSPATCQCGHDIASGWVARKPRYTMLDGFFVLFGISAAPYAIEFTCRKCGDVVAVANDAQAIRKFI